MKIDSHHHFWKYDPVEYGWIDDSMAALRRDFLPADLQQEIEAVGIDGVVSVQARQTLEETAWLLDFSDSNDFIRGVVGWVDLRHAEVAGQLDQFAGREKLKAVRHVAQDEPDDFLIGAEFNRGVGLLKNYDLVYDILIFERQLPASIKFVDKHPELTFVLDHIAKPRIGEKLLEPWRSSFLKLAQRPNVYCKVSGMVTEADYHDWSVQQLKPYWDTALEAFGPQRLMFGTDWPVCVVACKYARWHEIVSTFASELSVDEQASLFGGTAIKAYGL